MNATVNGITVHDRTVQWVTIARSGGRLRESPARRADLDVAEENLFEDFPKAVKRQCAGLKDWTALALPTPSLLIRVFQLPPAEADELRGMVELQLDKLSPFPIESMLVSHEVMGYTEDGPLVLAAAANRMEIESWALRFARCPVELRRVDAEVLGRFRLLTDASRIPAEGYSCIFIIEPTHCDLIVTADGSPILIKTLASRGELDDEEYAEEVVQEWSDTAMMMEIEHGVTDPLTPTLWGAGSAADVLAAKLEAAGAGEVAIEDLEALPPLAAGIARRAAAPDKATLDMAPPEWRLAARRRATWRRLILATSLALVAVVVAVAMLALAVGRERRLMTQEQQLLDIRNIETAKVREIRDRALSLKEFANRSHTALECLREIAVRLPGDDIILTSFVYRKGRTVAISGQGSTAEPLFDFEQSLDESELFERVTMSHVKQVGAKQVFSMTLEFRR